MEIEVIAGRTSESGLPCLLEQYDHDIEAVARVAQAEKGASQRFGENDMGCRRCGAPRVEIIR